MGLLRLENREALPEARKDRPVDLRSIVALVCTDSEVVMIHGRVAFLVEPISGLRVRISQHPAIWRDATRLGAPASTNI